MESYRIVIPSRRRTKLVQEALKLFPTATVYVDEREEADYKPVVPDGQLVLHAPTRNLPEVGNLMMHDFTEDSIVMIDDDVQGVRIGSEGFRKLHKDPLMLLDVIENGVQIAEDAGVGLFGWSRNANPMHYAMYDPFGVAGPICAVWIRRGPARYRKMDPLCASREDADLVMRTLVEDRIVLFDRRFYFPAKVFGGAAGGAVDITSNEQYRSATERIMSKWSRYVELTKPSRQREKGNQKSGQLKSNKDGLSIRVQRRNPIALG